MSRVQTMKWMSIAALPAVVFVLAAQPAPCQGGASRMRAVQEIRIDGVREDLSVFGQVAVRHDGRMAIAQPQDGNVVLYGATGARLGVVGRTGGGPGEFGDALRLRIGWIGDTLWTYDPGLRRFSLFVNTTFVESWLLPDAATGASQRIEAVRPGRAPVSMPEIEYGIRVLTGMRPETLRPNRDIVGVANYGILQHMDVGEDLGAQIAHVAAAGGAPLRITDLPPDDYMVSLRRPGSMVGIAVPFLHSQVWHIAPEGRHAAFVLIPPLTPDAREFRVVSIGAGGDTVFARTIPFAAERIPGRLAAAAVEQEVSRLRRRLSPQDIGQLESLMSAKLPEVYSPIARVRVGRDGVVWVELRDTDEGTPMLGLDAEGNPFGTIVVPREARIAVGSRTHVWVIERDADDIQSLVRYRVL
jgi:hypothetical protein